MTQVAIFTHSYDDYRCASTFDPADVRVEKIGCLIKQPTETGNQFTARCEEQLKKLRSASYEELFGEKTQGFLRAGRRDGAYYHGDVDYEFVDTF